MNLELNVVRFENEDVIATSCGNVAGFSQLSYKYDDEEGTLLGLSSNPIYMDDETMMFDENGVNTGEWFDYSDGWYHWSGTQIDTGVGSANYYGEYIGRAIKCTDESHHYSN